MNGGSSDLEAQSTGYTRSPRTTLKVATGFPPGSPLERIEYLIAIGGPIGFIPWVPATFASLSTAAAWKWLPNSTAVIATAAAACALLGGRVGTTAERLLKLSDPRNVVIDEIAGQSLTFLFVRPETWRVALAGFLLFRIFDVLKPFPGRRAEKLRGGWGIVADDLIAGAYAAVSLLAVHAFVWK